MLAALYVNYNQQRGGVESHPGPDGGSEEDYRILQLGIWRKRQVRLALEQIRQQAPQPVIDKSYELAQYSIERLLQDATEAYAAEQNARLRIELELDAIMADLAGLQQLQAIYRQWREEEAFLVLLMMV